MNEEGLAQAMGGQPQIDPQMLEQIAMMLAQGVTPEELIAQGVPEEVIRAAMQMIQEKTQPKPEQSGLAGLQVQGSI